MGFAIRASQFLSPMRDYNLTKGLQLTKKNTKIKLSYTIPPFPFLCTTIRSRKNPKVKQII